MNRNFIRDNGMVILLALLAVVVAALVFGRRVRSEFRISPGAAPAAETAK